MVACCPHATRGTCPGTRLRWETQGCKEPSCQPRNTGTTWTAACARSGLRSLLKFDSSNHIQGRGPDPSTGLNQVLHCTTHYCRPFSTTGSRCSHANFTQTSVTGFGHIFHRILVSKFFLWFPCCFWVSRAILGLQVKKTRSSSRHFASRNIYPLSVSCSAPGTLSPTYHVQCWSVSGPQSLQETPP